MTVPIVSIRQLTVHFPNEAARAPIQALRGVDLDVHAGQIVGLIGESGCGKSTLGRAILGRIAPLDGAIRWRGRDLAGLGEREMRDLRRDIQMIPQDPAGSLNPRRRIGDAIAEPLLVHRPELDRRAIRDRVAQCLISVGLTPEFADRFPNALSGGQAQRVAIARALVAEPSLIVCDEPVSALDVSIQAQILALLLSLRQERNLALLFISHDLAVVRSISHEVAVMYLGRIVEQGRADAVCRSPLHPYTKALVSAVPAPDPTLKSQRTTIAGEPPSPIDPPSGCGFRTRCPLVMPLCANRPEPASDRPDHIVWCHAMPAPGPEYAP